MKKDELIEVVRMLENNWSNALERHENTINYHKKTIADLEQEKCELLGIIQGKDKVIAQTKELLRRVIEWSGWQSGSKCPSFQDIEKDIKTFLEE